jgi:hypothetical protein
VEGGTGGGDKGANKMKRYILSKVRLSKVKQSYISMEEELEYERKFYSEELGKEDWKQLKKAGELFIIHAYTHLFEIPQLAYRFAEKLGIDASQINIAFDDEYDIKYRQFNLNLAVGLEILLKSLLLKKGLKINQKIKDEPNNSLDPEKTIQFSTIINKRLKRILPKLSKSTIKEIQDTLRLINLRRNNIAHCSKRSYDSYAYEHRFSYITLYIYERYFFGENAELTALLLKSLERSKVTDSSDFRPLKIKPRSLR